jgi:hypothetical protein
MHTLQKPSPPSNHRAILRIKISMIFVVLFIDVTTMPYCASTLQESNNPRPSPNLRCATPQRPDIVVAEHAPYTTTCLH